MMDRLIESVADRAAHEATKKIMGKCTKFLQSEILRAVRERMDGLSQDIERQMEPRCEGTVLYSFCTYKITCESQMSAQSELYAHFLPANL